MTDKREHIKKHYSSERVAEQLLRLIQTDKKNDKDMDAFQLLKFTDNEYSRIKEIENLKRISKSAMDPRWKNFTVAEMQMYIAWIQNKQDWVKLMRTVTELQKQKSQFEKFQAFLEEDGNKFNNKQTQKNDNILLEVWGFVNHLNKKIALAKNPILVPYVVASKNK